MNDEMDCEMLLHPDMSLSRRIAYGDNALQCAQIDSFISEDVDLLVVSPNDPEKVGPAVSRAYRADIPVIIADRRIAGDEWTAFIGGDNYAVGQLMAEWVTGKLKIKNSKFKIKSDSFEVLEVQGMKESMPEQLRHQGFMDGLQSSFPSSGSMPVVHSVCGAYDAYTAVSEFLDSHGPVDAIVAQNDLMAIEASKAADRYSIPIMGVDGIIVGLQAIVDGAIECTAVYPTRGDLIVNTAVQILEGKPYVRDTILETMLIDVAAAYPMLKQYQQRMHDLNTIRIMQMQTQVQQREMESNKTLLLTVICVLAALFLLAIGSVIVIQRRMQRKITGTILPQLENVQEVLQISQRDAAFMENVQQIVDEHLSDPELNVEYLSSTLQLDRTQVFRRVKAVAGKGPLDYLELCFSSPGYFTKCYKEYFGHLPSAR